MEVKFPFIINGEAVMLTVGKDQLPPAGTGTVIYYSPDYLQR